MKKMIIILLVTGLSSIIFPEPDYNVAQLAKLAEFRSIARMSEDAARDFANRTKSAKAWGYSDKDLKHPLTPDQCIYEMKYALRTFNMFKEQCHLQPTECYKGCINICSPYKTLARLYAEELKLLTTIPYPTFTGYVLMRIRQTMETKIVQSDFLNRIAMNFSK